MSKFEEIINSDTPVLIDFSAEWCGPCKAFAPVLKEIAGLVDGKARVIKIDIDKNQQVAMKYGIQSVPTLMIFKKGEIKWRQSGALPKEQIISIISKYY
ncbi:MAG: thioredoxin [Bacteroidota bacterium]